MSVQGGCVPKFEQMVSGEAPSAFESSVLQGTCIAPDGPNQCELPGDGSPGAAKPTTDLVAAVTMSRISRIAARKRCQEPNTDIWFLTRMAPK